MEEKGKIYWLPSIMGWVSALFILWCIISGIKTQLIGLHEIDTESSWLTWLLAAHMLILIFLIHFMFKNFKELVIPTRHAVPKFKPGDIIQDKKYNTIRYIITDIKRGHYILGNSKHQIEIDLYQDDYEKIGTVNGVVDDAINKIIESQIKE